MFDDDDDDEVFDKFNPELVKRRKRRLEQIRAEKLRHIDPEKFVDVYYLQGYIVVLALGQTRSDRFLLLRRLIYFLFGYLILNPN
jgi:hypothetical protein